MSEKYKHPSMMLFGKMIHSGSKTNDDFVIASRFVPSSAARDDFDDDCESTNSGHSLHCSKQDKTTGNEEATTEEEMDTEQQEELSSNSVLENPKTPATPSTDTENPKTHSKDEVCLSQDLPKRDQDQSDQESSNSDSQDQITLKKPDTILPCPRCSSMDTKFCYFNNYNVNQPRYFCKKCQRYWTAGGSMRNVPVGAGRRKSKNSAAYQHRHLVIPGAYDGITPHAMRSDGAVLAFGMDSPPPNPSKESQTFLTNVFFRSEHENKSSVLLSNPNSVSMEKGRNCNGVMTESSQPVLCLPYSWNPIPWQTGFPVSFSSAALPQRGGSVPAEPCNLQWLSTPSLNSDQSSTTSSPDNSTTLGKHSREGRILTSSNTDNNESSKEKEFEISSVVMPKKLRIDDPLDVSKSSIWTTLGIKNNNQNVSSSIGRVAYFGGLQQAS